MTRYWSSRGASGPFQRAVHIRRGLTQQEAVIETLQEYLRHHEDEQQRAAAFEDGVGLLSSGVWIVPLRTRRGTELRSRYQRGTGWTAHPL